VNKNSSNFDKNISLDDNFTGSKWTLLAYRKFFKENNLDFETLWTKIIDIVTKAIICAGDQTISTVKKLTPHNNNLFELYGFDILIDENLNPCLLEINLNPSLNCDTELDLKVKSSLMTDIFNLVGVIPYAHPDINSSSNNNNATNVGNKSKSNSASIYTTLSNAAKEPSLMLDDLNVIKDNLFKNEINSTKKNADVKMNLEHHKEKLISEGIVAEIIEEYDKLGFEMNHGNDFIF